MKIRASILALSLAATGAVAAPQAVAQEAATKTMAELYDPTFAELSQPFGSGGWSDVSEEIAISGLPDEAKITVLPTPSTNASRNGAEIHNVSISANRSHSLRFQIFDFYNYSADSVEVDPKILIEYPDGSNEIVQHTFKVKTYQKFSYKAYVSGEALPPGKRTTIPLQGLPEDARVTLLEAPAEWNASLEGHTLSAQPASAGNGHVLLKVVYADGTSELTKLLLEAGNWSNPDKPRGSGASLPPWSIAIITASVLAVFGGIAAFLLPRLAR